MECEPWVAAGDGAQVFAWARVYCCFLSNLGVRTLDPLHPAIVPVVECLQCLSWTSPRTGSSGRLTRQSSCPNSTMASWLWASNTTPSCKLHMAHSSWVATAVWGGTSQLGLPHCGDPCIYLWRCGGWPAMGLRHGPFLGPA